jgi:hypothetical protein
MSAMQNERAETLLERLRVMQELLREPCTPNDRVMARVMLGELVDEAQNTPAAAVAPVAVRKPVAALNVEGLVLCDDGSVWRFVRDYIEVSAPHRDSSAVGPIHTKHPAKWEPVTPVPGTLADREATQ